MGVGGSDQGLGVGEVRGRGGHLVGGQGGCERRSKVFVKIQKENFFLRVGGGGGSGWGGSWGVRSGVGGGGGEG